MRKVHEAERPAPRGRRQLGRRDDSHPGPGKVHVAEQPDVKSRRQLRDLRVRSQTTHDANAYLDAVLSAAPGPGICI